MAKQMGKIRPAAIVDSAHYIYHIYIYIYICVCVCVCHLKEIVVQWRDVRRHTVICIFQFHSERFISSPTILYIARAFNSTVCQHFNGQASGLLHWTHHTASVPCHRNAIWYVINTYTVLFDFNCTELQTSPLLYIYAYIHTYIYIYIYIERERVWMFSITQYSTGCSNGSSTHLTRGWRTTRHDVILH